MNAGAQAGLEFSAEYEGRIDAYLAKNAAERAQLKANKASKKASDKLHEYSLADYGLSEEEVRKTFQDYIDKYDLAEAKKSK